ncbi:hypothetical protein C8F04DRAFT_1398165 [Mycena alexandri]|uniref:Uncharacterized protein n=1 Tax=Mycena alexandri TaxID=1745969 RepID=A0AAD6SQB7_9AGAR|nr:hypothetical protein C8F04DRAFT_1398165 [Mycena alexandri]
MQALPPELHSKICRIACRDDGTTSRSLSQVSKRIRDVSAPYRYHSIAVSGPVQIHKLVDRLRSIPPEFRRIRFLFIYDYASLNSPPRFRRLVAFQDPAAAVTATREDFDALRAEMEALRSEPDDIRNWIYPSDLRRDLAEILSMAQETVELLSVVSVKAGTDRSLLQGSFPALEHLTIRGPHTVPISPTFAPRLSTLNVTEDALAPGFASTLAHNHPNLLRLRIFQCFDIARRIGDTMQLAYVMGITAPRISYTLPPPQLRSGVERLLLLEPCTQTELRNFSSRLRLLPVHENLGKAEEARRALRDWRLSAFGMPTPWAAGDPAWDDNPFVASQGVVEPQYYSGISTMEVPFHYHTRPAVMPQIITLFQ